MDCPCSGCASQHNRKKVEAGLEQALTAGLEAAPANSVHRWSEEENASISGELAQKLGPSVQRLDLYPYNPKPLFYRSSVSEKRQGIYGVERWGGSAEGLVFIRIGPLFFMDETAYGRLDDSLRERLGGNLIRVDHLGNSLIANQGYGPYAMSMIAAMLENDLKDRAILDLGAGDGCLSIVAMRLGASWVEAIEIEEEMVQRARRNFILNGLKEDVDVHLIQGNLRQMPKIQTPFLRVGLLLKTVVLSNIGTWPGKFSATNADSIRLIAEDPSVALFLGGGYFSYDGLDPSSRNMRPISFYEDLEEIKRHGFSWAGTSGYSITGEDHTQYLWTWVAARSDFLAGLEAAPVAFEREIAAAVAIAEEAAGLEGRAVILDVTELEKFPWLVPIIQQFDRLSGRLILLGESDVASGLEEQNPAIYHIGERSPDAVSAVLGQMKVNEVTYIGSPALSGPVRIAAAGLEMAFSQQPFSIKTLLEGFGVPEGLASTLAAGMEQAVGLGRQV